MSERPIIPAQRAKAARAPHELDWTEHYATNGQITTPSGVIVEGA